MIYFSSYQNNFGVMVEYGGNVLVLLNKDLAELFDSNIKENYISMCKAMNFNNLSATSEDYDIEYDKDIETWRLMLAKIFLMCYYEKLEKPDLFNEEESIVDFIDMLKYKLSPLRYGNVRDEIEAFEEYSINFGNFKPYLLQNVYNTENIMSAVAMLTTINFFSH